MTRPTQSLLIRMAILLTSQAGCRSRRPMIASSDILTGTGPGYAGGRCSYYRTPLHNILQPLNGLSGLNQRYYYSPGSALRLETIVTSQGTRRARSLTGKAILARTRSRHISVSAVSWGRGRVVVTRARRGSFAEHDAPLCSLVSMSAARSPTVFCMGYSLHRRTRSSSDWAFTTSVFPSHFAYPPRYSHINYTLSSLWLPCCCDVLIPGPSSPMALCMTIATRLEDPRGLDSAGRDFHAFPSFQQKPKASNTKP